MPTVIINYMTASHKGSGGKSPAFPDVCKTPTPGGPVPIPYPNIAQSSDLASGSKKVKFDGESVSLKGSNLSTSTGDEAGTAGGGVVSNVTKGKAQFVNYSFDVKVEGDNVCRLLDPTTNNMSSMNTAAFAHLQAPAQAGTPGAGLINAACGEVKKQVKKQPQKVGADGSPQKESGIIADHWKGMLEYLDRQPIWMLYFRKTSKYCGNWIAADHEPKPHSVTDGKSLKPGKGPGNDPREDLIAWLKTWGNWPTLAFRKAMGHIAPDLHVGVPEDGRSDEFYERMAAFAPHLDRLKVEDTAPLYGVVIRTSERNRGEPQLALQKQFVGKWMTADYDLMDVLMVGDQCQRPAGFAFDLLKVELNGAMGWPGIQHPWMSVWNTRRDRKFHGPKEFKVLGAMQSWLKDVALAKFAARRAPEGETRKAAEEAAKKKASEVPQASLAPGRDPQNLIDNELTILAPKGGLFLQTHDDYWNALVCCGCLDLDKPTQDESDLESAGGKATEAQVADPDTGRPVQAELNYKEASKR